MKKIRGLLIILTIICCISSVLCEEKTVDVKLDKGYTNGVFNIIYDSDVNCAGYVESPLGNTYECISQESGYMYCQIDNIESGDWKIKLSSEKDIGKVTVNLSANNEIANDENNNISIVRKITGLSAYLENRTVKAEWTDTKCGDVLVIVSDSATKKTLDSNIVKEAYQYEIPTGYENVSIMLVPSSLASREEAKTSYTFALNDVPKIEVIHNIGSVTKEDEVRFEVNTSEKCSYTSFINGNENKNSDKLLFSTVDGENHIKIIATNEKGHKTTYEYNFEKDTEAPVLTLDNDWSGFVTNDAAVTVSGIAQNAFKVVVNGEEAPINESGTFTKNVSLKDGTNEVKIVAIDEAGNEALFIMNIEKSIPSSKNYISDIIVMILIIATIFVVVFLLGRKKPSKKKEPKEKKDVKKKEKSEKKSKKVVGKEKSTKTEPVQNQNIETVDVNDEQFKTVEVAEVESVIKSESVEIKSMESEVIKEEMKEEIVTVVKENENKNTNKDKRNTKKVKEKNENITNHIYSRRKNRIFEYIIWILSIILIVSVTQFILRIDVVQSNSMEPNIMTGELLFTNRLIDGSEIERGDIITFKMNNTAICKRVVGMEGDVITFSQGYVCINGEYCRELYLAEDVETNSLKSFTVPKGCFLCLGDNREISFDARNWDNPYVRNENIYGKVILHIPFLNIFE